jgi:hypothetical protein
MHNVDKEVHPLAGLELSDDKVMATIFNEANYQFLLSTFKEDMTLLVHFHAVVCGAECDDDETASFAECDEPAPMLK